MHFQIPVRVTVALIVIIIPSSTILISTSNYFGSTTNYFGSTTNFAYGQTNQTIFNNANPLNIQNIPIKKVHVGDIDIAYRTFGKGEPILLIEGMAMKMDAWEPSILKNLSTNHTVIIFDNRGVGNTTTGTKPFSIQQLANDTTGLLDALKIQKTDILGYSLGSLVAQQLAVTHPEKVNRLILYAASSGGKESIPLSPQLQKIITEIIKNATNNLPINARMLTNLTAGPELKSHPSLLQSIPEHLNFSQVISVPLNTYKKDFGTVLAWASTNWSGICDKLTKVSSPTLIITGTADKNVNPANSLVIASKIPDAWLVHIKDATHDKFNKVLQTFLSTTTGQNSTARTSISSTEVS